MRLIYFSTEVSHQNYARKLNRRFPKSTKQPPRLHPLLRQFVKPQIDVNVGKMICYRLNDLFRCYSATDSLSLPQADDAICRSNQAALVVTIHLDFPWANDIHRTSSGTVHMATTCLGLLPSQHIVCCNAPEPIYYKVQHHLLFTPSLTVPWMAASYLTGSHKPFLTITNLHESSKFNNDTASNSTLMDQDHSLPDDAPQDTESEEQDRMKRLRYCFMINVHANTVVTRCSSI